MVRRAQLDGLPGDINMAQDEFFFAIADASSAGYSGRCGLLDGPYIGLLNSLEGTLAVCILDAYKRVCGFILSLII